jgi:hypothetical protein
VMFARRFEVGQKGVVATGGEYGRCRERSGHGLVSGNLCGQYDRFP